MVILIAFWGRNSVGRVSHWQCESREFKSLRLHQLTEGFKPSVFCYIKIKGADFMSSKALYILAGLDDFGQNTMTEYQNNLIRAGLIGTQTKNIPYHITIGSFDTTMEADLINQITEYANNNHSFSLMYNHLGIFSGGKVLFACPDVTQKLLHLKENFNSSDNWTAHTTLFIEEKEQVLRAVDLLLAEFKPFTAKIDSLHLYEFFPTRHILTVKLK